MLLGLNHSVAPHLGVPDFLRLAHDLGVRAVELRESMPPGWEFPAAAHASAHDPALVARMASDLGLRLLSLNALVGTDHWNPGTQRQAQALIEYAALAGVEALVLCPTVAPPGEPAAPTGLSAALDALQPLLEDAGVRGLVEPLGFPGSSVRLQELVEDELRRRGSPSSLGIVHDTFHHAIADDPHYSARTALVHLSGVAPSPVPRAGLGDADRILVGPGDVLGTLDQARRLASLTPAPWTLEPFSPRVFRSPTLAADLRSCLAFVRAAVEPGPATD